MYSFVFDRTPTFDKDIALNDFTNASFYRFLIKNEGRIVFIDSLVEMSPALISHVGVLQACNDAYPSSYGERDVPELLDGHVYNRRIVLPINENRDETGDCVSHVTIEIVHDGDIADLSYGGTGLVTFKLNGFFDIESRFYSGPEKRIYLVRPEHHAASAFRPQSDRSALPFAPNAPRSAARIWTQRALRWARIMRILCPQPHRTA